MRASTFFAALAMVGTLASAASAQDAALRDLSVEQSSVAQAGTSRPGTLRMSTWFDRGDMTYAQGETVHIFVQTNQDAYVTVFNVGPSGQAIQLFPNAFQTNNLVRGNVPVEIPSADARIAVNGPFGAELVKIIASDRPLTIVGGNQLDNHGGAFRSLPGGAGALQRDLEVMASPTTQDRNIVIVNRGIRTVAARGAAMIQAVPVLPVAAAHGAAAEQISVSGIALATVGVGLAPLPTQNPFQFVNLHASASIVAAWSARAGTREPWDPITLYSPIEPRSASRINVSGTSGCSYDLKVRFDDGYEQTFSNVDLCRVAQVVAD